MEDKRGKEEASTSTGWGDGPQAQSSEQPQPDSDVRGDLPAIARWSCCLHSLRVEGKEEDSVEKGNSPFQEEYK